MPSASAKLTLGGCEVQLLEVINERLAICFLPQTLVEGNTTVLAANRDYYFYTMDKALIYEQFFADFGPLNLGCLIRFCRHLETTLKDPAHQGKVIVYYAAEHQHRRANAAYLMGCFSVLVLNRNVAAAYAPFIGIQPPLQPFRDAAFGINTWPLLVLDVIRGVHKVWPNVLSSLAVVKRDKTPSPLFL